MRILHAAFHKGCLRFWAESAPQEALAPDQPATAARYPYRTDSAALRDCLRQAGLSLPTDGPAASEQIIWLPTQGGVPLPSSPLVAEPPKSRKPLILSDRKSVV